MRGARGETTIDTTAKTSGKIYSVRGGFDIVLHSGAQARTYGTYLTRAEAIEFAREMGHEADDAPRGDGCTYLRRAAD